MRTQAVADLGCYFVVHAASGETDPALADTLREHDLVEFAYPKPPVALPSAPAGDDLRGGQGYLDDAPGGIGARAAWERPGGTGAGVRIIDVEGDWRFTHQDLGARSALAGGSPAGDVERRNHGTNVLGMLIGVHDDARRRRHLPGGRRARGLLPARGPLGQRPRDRIRGGRAARPATSCWSRCSGPARARTPTARVRTATCR